jgi:hypothetical protein
MAAPWLIMWLSAYNIFLLYLQWICGCWVSASIQPVLYERRDDRLNWMASFRRLITLQEHYVQPWALP